MLFELVVKLRLYVFHDFGLLYLLAAVNKIVNLIVLVDPRLED